MMNIDGDSLCRSIQKAIASETERIIADEAQEAGRRVERRVKEMTAQIAANVLEKFQMQRFENELRISVYFPPKT